LRSSILVLAVLRFLSELVHVVSTSDLTLSRSVLESADTFLLCHIHLCFLLVVVVSVLVGVLGCFDHVVLEALIVKAISVAGTLELSDTREDIEFVVFPPSVEATTAERGCDLETALTCDHFCTLGTVLIVGAGYVFSAFAVPTLTPSLARGTESFCVIVRQIHSGSAGCVQEVSIASSIRTRLYTVTAVFGHVDILWRVRHEEFRILPCTR
jgi:hypothetical protein